MTTWGDFLGSLRSELADTASKPKWSDAQLFSYFKSALYDYSHYFPRRVDRATLAMSDDTAALPTDFVADIAVESPQDRYLEKRSNVPGKWFRDVGSHPTYYYTSGGNLYLNGSPTDEVLLTYMALHLIPANEADTAYVLSIPDVDLELLSLHVKWSVYTDMRSKQSRLDRFDPGSGRRDDNPLSPETDALMDAYQRKISERIGGGTIKLFRRGRQ